MTKIVKFNKRRTVGGFTFHAGWFGEFSDCGELVKVYGYPWIEFDYWTQSTTWNNYRVFYKVGSDFEGDWERWEEAPEAVHKHFWNIAEYQERCYIEDYYNTAAN